MSTTCRLRTLDGSSLERTLTGQQAFVHIQDFVNDLLFSLALSSHVPQHCRSVLTICPILHAVLYPG